MMLDAFAWSFLVNNITPDQIMKDNFGKMKENQGKSIKLFNYLLLLGTFVVYWHQDFAPMLFAWGFLALSFYKNMHLRTRNFIV